MFSGEPYNGEYDELINEVSVRIEGHRNQFAHGDIEKEIYSGITTDFKVLQYLSYCIVLRHVGYSDDEIFNIIIAVFKLQIMPRFDEPCNGID